MKFLENDLEEIIYTSGRKELEKRGLLIEGDLRRQFKIGNYGIADLVSITRPFYDYSRDCKKEILVPGRINIFELKKEKIGIAAFLQSLKYAKGIFEYLKLRNKQHLFSIGITLIGKDVDTTGSFCYIPDLLSFNSTQDYGYIEFYTYEYNIDGIWFTNEYGYNLKDNGFKL